MPPRKISGFDKRKAKSYQSLEVKLDWAGAITQAQEGVELTVKALLDSLEIAYVMQRRNKKEYLQDVSSKLPELFTKLEPKFEDFERQNTRLYLAQTAVVLRMLTGGKDYARYGIPELNLGTGNIFDYHFARDLAKSLVESARSLCSHFWNNWYRWKL